jgi:alanine dehydrogenase
VISAFDEVALAVMPAFVTSEGTSRYAGAKLMMMSGREKPAGLPPHVGVVVLLDASTMSVACIIDGVAITALRTAAATAAATDALANEDASILAVIGAGVQAEAHVRALARCRDLDEVRIWSRTGLRAASLAARLSDELRVDVAAYPTVMEAARGADLICTVTSSSEPLLSPDMVSPGTHINAIGASFPTGCEIEPGLVSRSRVFVDQRDAALSEAGDLLRAIRNAALDPSSITEMGEVLAQRVQGRTSHEDVTLFKSVGLSLQDLYAAVLLQSRRRDRAADPGAAE